MLSISRRDVVRRILVTVAGVFCVLGTLVGFGVVGKPIQQTAGGALSSDATLMAPAGPAFAIWSLIYLGLAGYVGWQWVAPGATRSRARRLGYLAAVSMVLNAGWVLVAQAGWLWLSVVVIVALLVVLVVILQRLAAQPAGSAMERLVVDGTFGCYLGWVSIATCANVTTALVAQGLTLGPTASTLAAVVLILAAGAVAVLLAWRFGGRWAVAAAMAWGLGWIGVGRLAAQPSSPATGVVAVAAALVAVLSAAAIRLRGREQPG